MESLFLNVTNLVFEIFKLRLEPEVLKQWVRGSEVDACPSCFIVQWPFIRTIDLFLAHLTVVFVEVCANPWNWKLVALHLLETIPKGLVLVEHYHLLFEVTSFAAVNTQLLAYLFEVVLPSLRMSVLLEVHKAEQAREIHHEILILNRSYRFLGEWLLGFSCLFCFEVFLVDALAFVQVFEVMKLKGI